MGAVLVDVCEVVEEIDGAGEEREDEGGGEAAGEEFRVCQLVAEDERREDEGVLDPLMWSQAFEERQEHLRRLVGRGCGVKRRLGERFGLTGAAGVR
jgi:hypothetical protein